MHSHWTFIAVDVPQCEQRTSRAAYVPRESAWPASCPVAQRVLVMLSPGVPVLSPLDHAVPMLSPRCPHSIMLSPYCPHLIMLSPYCPHSIVLSPCCPHLIVLSPCCPHLIVLSPCCPHLIMPFPGVHLLRPAQDPGHHGQRLTRGGRSAAAGAALPVTKCRGRCCSGRPPAGQGSRGLWPRCRPAIPTHPTAGGHQRHAAQPAGHFFITGRRNSVARQRAALRRAGGGGAGRCWEAGRGGSSCCSRLSQVSLRGVCRWGVHM